MIRLLTSDRHAGRARRREVLAGATSATHSQTRPQNVSIGQSPSVQAWACTPAIKPIPAVRSTGGCPPNCDVHGAIRYVRSTSIGVIQNVRDESPRRVETGPTDLVFGLQRVAATCRHWPLQASPSPVSHSGACPHTADRAHARQRLAHGRLAYPACPLDRCSKPVSERPARSVNRPSRPSPLLPLHARQQWPCRGESGSAARSRTRARRATRRASASTYS